MASSDENKELVQRVQYDTYTREEDLALIDELVSDEFVQYDSAMGEIHGPDEFRESVDSFRTAFPDITFSIDHLVAEDDIVASHFTARGTHEGPIPELGIEPSGESIEVEGMEFDRVKDGRLVESWLLYDTFGLLQQLGVISADDVPGE